jgi:hypothetical protein
MTHGAIYRVRITLNGSGGATYEIQGGPEYAKIGGATWTNITPATSSGTGTTEYAGVVAFDKSTWISDVKMY